MTKLSNKQHEAQQDRRIKKLESDLKQQKVRVDKLEKRIKTNEKIDSKTGTNFKKLEKELNKLKKQINLGNQF